MNIWRRVLTNCDRIYLSYALFVSQLIYKFYICLSQIHERILGSTDWKNFVSYLSENIIYFQILDYSTTNNWYFLHRYILMSSIIETSTKWLLFLRAIQLIIFTITSQKLLWQNLASKLDGHYNIFWRPSLHIRYDTTVWL